VFVFVFLTWIVIDNAVLSGGMLRSFVCVVLFDFAIINFSMQHHNDHYLYPRGLLQERPLDNSQALKHANLSNARRTPVERT
jgi:hypothetical protein